MATFVKLLIFILLAIILEYNLKFKLFVNINNYSNEESNKKSKFICQGGALEQVDAFGSAGLTGDQGSTGTEIFTQIPRYNPHYSF